MSHHVRYRSLKFCTTLLGGSLLLAGMVNAADPAVLRDRGQTAKSAALEQLALPSSHLQKQARSSAQRAPTPALHSGHRSDYDLPDALSAKLARPSAAGDFAKADCSTSQFANLSGSALVTAVKAATSECINGLFNLSGSTATGTFREAQMVTIATALQSAAASYNGTNSGSALQLILFLRAGYYVQYYDPATVGSYGTSLRNAIRPALDAFAANASFGLVNDAHGEVLAEFVTLIDSSTENARYLPVVKRLLGNYNPSAYAPFFWMKSAVNNSYTVLFRGHYDAAFVSAVQADTSIVDTLYNFANANFSQLGGSDDYLVSNAGRELGRFLQYTGSLQSLARSRAKALLDRSSVTGNTAPLWVGLGEMVDYYDKANCSYYNLCDFQQRLETAVLPISYNCSSTLRLRAQSMSQTEINTACATVAGQENYFHTQVASNRVPVANDNNSALEMVVFDSSSDYGTYAGALFGIDTNNGGMYLEGDPSVAGNQARFIAYEAEWQRPSFEIWNLTHEYVHYLDGRFNMYGDFSAAMAQKTVWWVEGFAEYMSYSYRNLAYSEATAEAAAGTYPISTIFQNDYNSGTTRVYRWGYLGVRFMFEKHRADVSSILGLFRPGNYTGYASFMNGLGTRYDTEFRSFLACVANPSGSGCSGGSVNVPPVANFSFVANGLGVTFSDGSSDSDGSIASRSWSFGDGTSSTATNPSKTYASAGTYTVSLSVTDNAGASHSVSRSVTVSSGGGGSSELQNGVARTGLTAAANAKLAFTFDVPAGATNLRFVMSGGSGDADLYVRYGSAPTTTAYDCRPYAGGNAETCTITNVQAGRYHVMLNAYAAFSGVSLVASYTAPSGGLAECSGSDLRVLGKNCQRSNMSATQGNYAYFFVNIPAGTSQLRIRSSGGTGDANLYANAATWATTSAYQQRSINAGNSETLTINNPPAGYFYISLHAASAFSGVTISTEY
ncbi:collagenase [Tahibacter aquaticus]|uniref:microbial collagenase n=1 Tax=Tahibacter aquaticus TaxID=520092 RepID=A0A4V3DLK5_9GAMM|nr:collagenase [Tahibacter aquaticus]TDR40064.1 collagenase [Tahibacter aquaticus]